MSEEGAVNLVFVIDTLNRGGGTERYVAEHASLLSQRYPTYILSLDCSLSSSFEIDDKVRRITTQKKYKRHRLQKFPTSFFVHRELKKIFSDLPALKIFIPVGLRLNHFFLSSYSDFPKSKVLMCEHLAVEDAQKQRAGIKIRNEKNFFQAHMIAQTDKAVSQYKESLEKVFKISNFVNLGENVKPKSILNPDEIKIVSIGSLQKHKGYMRALDFLEELKKLNVNFTYSLYGVDLKNPKEPFFQKSFLSEVSRRGLCKNIQFHDFKKDLSLVYGDKDFLLICSLAESFSYAAIEAKAFGLPVLSYDFTGDPHEVIRHGSDGYIESNSKLLAQRCAFLSANEGEYNKFSQQAICDVQARFTPEVVLRQWSRTLGLLRFEKNST